MLNTIEETRLDGCSKQWQPRALARTAMFDAVLGLLRPLARERIVI
jgi:hypothetical protein